MLLWLFVVSTTWFGSSPLLPSGGNGVAVSDSVRLATQVRPWLLNRHRPGVQLALTSPQPRIYRTDYQYALCFDSVRLSGNPEGVYEVYITQQTTPIPHLKPEKPAFVGVLDTYQLTTSAKPQTLCLDATEVVQKWGGASLKSCLISLVFRGNTLPSGKAAQEAGKLSGGRIRLSSIH
jgi:hypothetical protein